jgi:sec-independent protein translocase protein TatB
MPSFGDSAFIFILALLLFGPKKLPELARQLGKLMAEFRRASNEFRIQMDEELRIADQAEQQKKIAAMEAAAPPQPAIASDSHDVTPDDPEYPTTEPAIPLPIASEGDLSLMPPSTGLPTPRGSEAFPVTETEEPSETAALTPVLENIPHTPDPTNEPGSYYLPTPPDRHTHNAAETTESTSEAPLHG